MCVFLLLKPLFCLLRSFFCASKGVKWITVSFLILVDRHKRRLAKKTRTNTAFFWHSFRSSLWSKYINKRWKEDVKSVRQEKGDSFNWRYFRIWKLQLLKKSNGEYEIKVKEECFYYYFFLIFNILSFLFFLENFSFCKFRQNCTWLKSTL